VLRAVATVCGVANLWFGRRALVRARSRIEILYAACILSVGVMGLLWPVDNGILFDHLVRVTGLSLLLRYVGLTLGLVCGFASLSALIEGWSRWHRAALIVYATLVLVLSVVWNIARDAAASDPTRLLYTGYYGRPLPLLAWNMLVGLTIVYSCGLLILEMGRIPQGAQDREARVAMRVVSAVLFAFGAGGGLLIAGQALASRLGFRATGAASVLDVTTTVALTAVPILNTWSFYVLPLWRVFTLRWEVQALHETRQDLVRLLALLSDRLAHLIDHADPAIVQAVALRSRHHHLQPYHLDVLLEATRWIAFRRALIGRRSWDSIDAATRKTVDETIVKDAARRSRSLPYLYADVYLVVILVLGVHYVPGWLTLERAPREWHHALAALIGAALEEHNSAGREAVQVRSSAGREAVQVRSSAGQRHTAAWSTVGRTRLGHRGDMMGIWRSTRRWFSLPVAQQERIVAHDDLTALRMLCDDLLIYLRDQAAPDVIRAVIELCHELHVEPDHDRVAREAARWVGFFLPGVARGLWEETIAIMGREIGATADGGQQGMQRIRFLADASRIVLLVLRPEQIPAGIRPARASARWHRRAAGLIRAAVALGAPTGGRTSTQLPALPFGRRPV